ncbi:MAG: glycine cleavage system aminomethyltransferase GcvT [Chloroflexota bacterium]|nr:glycine cleavage system aminomethyltransferase GcvT [Chloroflexota bacterium]
MTAAQPLRRTPLYPQHVALGARMIPFAGWEMPVQYQGIVEEHHAVRQRAGLFDVSHMGRLEVEGPDAASFLRRLVTYDVARLAVGQGHYALVCQEDGGILDDVYVFRLAAERFLVVANSVNAERIRDWACQHLTHSLRAAVKDRQAETAMLALQGPQAARYLARVVPSLEELRRHHCAEVSLAGTTVFFSRTGYTGEDGFEIVLPAGAGGILWSWFVEHGVQPCGLGARDTLRLEAALPLYGHDLDTSVNPFEAGLGWAVTFDDGADFVGRQALLGIREAGVRRSLACLKAEERGVMRAGCPILHSGRRVGEVTSGGFSPSLGVSIGLGYLPPELAAVGTELQVDVRGRPLRAQVVPRPFYKRGKAG